MLRGLRQSLALPGGERRLLIRAFLSLGAIEVALWLLGFRRLIERAEAAAAPRGRVVGPDDVRRACHYARWLEVASRHHVVRARCLHRSLVLHQWLHHEGLPSELRIGVRKEQAGLRAHAWVELGGYVVNDRPAVVARFTPLAPHRWSVISSQ